MRGGGVRAALASLAFWLDPPCRPRSLGRSGERGQFCRCQEASLALQCSTVALHVTEGASQNTAALDTKPVMGRISSQRSFSLAVAMTAEKTLLVISLPQTAAPRRAEAAGITVASLGSHSGTQKQHPWGVGTF